MYNTDNGLTGFRIGRRLSGGTLILNNEQSAFQKQEGTFYRKAADDFYLRNITLKMDKTYEWFNHFTQIVGGMNNILNEQQNKPLQIAQAQQKEKKAWALFLGITIIIVVVLSGMYLIKKK